MTKIICEKINCQYLGEGYVCQLNKVKMRCCYDDKKEIFKCSNYKEDNEWNECVNTIQKKLDEEEVVI